MANVHEIYSDAQLKGRREYNRLKARGQSGHLPSLDGLLKDIEIVGTIGLGLYEIPLKKIVGTYYHSRRMMFTKSFLPLESEHTEFGQKWAQLCQAHLSEGIRDPIKVYEYMNYYYVLEGNKRVSVLKYFDAVSVTAEVTRLVPKYDPDDETIVLYYAFMEFYKETGLISVWLSKPDRYKRLLRYLERYNPPLNGYETKYEHFIKEVYLPFRSIYHRIGEKDVSITTGDAFLLYAKLYGIPNTIDPNLLRLVLPKLHLELSLGIETEESSVETTTDEIERFSLIGALSSLIVPKHLNVGFVYARNAQNSGWTYSHDLGRKHIEAVFKNQITTGVLEDVPENSDAFFPINEFAKHDYDVVFTTSEVFRRATLKCAIENPKTMFFNCSGSKPYVHMSNYFGRTYEARFLTGIIAGAMTQSNIVGYTATEPNPEVLSSINAFTIGMKMVNPNARLLVMWTGEWNNPKVTTDLSEVMIDMGADVISNKTLLVPRDVTSDFGVYAMLCSIDPITKKPKQYLASPIWKWGKFYEKIISSILNGTYQRMVASAIDQQKLIHFWWGIEAGVIDLYADDTQIPKETMKLVEVMKKLIVTDQFHPFSGELYDNKGQKRVASGTILSPDDILHMDWLLEGVEVIDIPSSYNQTQ